MNEPRSYIPQHSIKRTLSLQVKKSDLLPPKSKIFLIVFIVHAVAMIKRLFIHGHVTALDQSRAPLHRGYV